MEETTEPIEAPRISLRKITAGYGWNITSSSSNDLEEMKKILENIEVMDKSMKDKFPDEESKSKSKGGK